MSSGNIEKLVQDQKITLSDELRKAAMNFCSVSSSETKKYEILISVSGDLSIILNEKVSYGSEEMIIKTQSNFHRVDLPSYLVSNEILTIIGNKVFTRGFMEDGKCLFIVRDEYVNRQYLAPNKEPFMINDKCIQLTDALLSVCAKFLGFQKESLRLGRHYFLGNSIHETLEQQIENAIISERPHRILTLKPVGIERTVNTILEEYDKSIKSCVILSGSFTKSIDDKSLSDKSNSDNAKWIRVVCD